MHLLSVLSMKNRALIALVTIVIAMFGVISMTGLKQELIPSVTFPQLAIVTSYPGAAPEVVNDDVSTPIESAIQGVPGIESTSATSSTNLSMVSVQFTYGTNLATAEQKINQAINRIKSTLPADIDPQVLSGSIDDLPVIQIAVSGGGDADALAELLETSVVPDIKDVTGVNDASIIGQVGKRISITPDPEKLALNGLTTQSISSALKQNGTLLPAGTVTENDRTFAVQTGSKLGSVEDIAALPLISETPSAAGKDTAAGAGKNASTGAGKIVTIGDVATVELTDDPITSISRVNGEPALTIAVTKLPSANTVDVSKGVRALLPELEKTIGSDSKLTVVFDQAPYIEQSIESLTQEGLLGLAFAVLIILLFLFDVRATIVTAISIPTSVLITFIGLQVAQYSLNILTLGALTIAIGRVVDDSIVVIENIKRHLSFGDNRTAKARAGSVLSAVTEVAGAITASTVTTVAVFLPLAFVGDMTGELFRPFALTVTIALLASLFVALTIVPVLAYWFLRAPKAVRKALAEADAKAAEAAETAGAEAGAEVSAGAVAGAALTAQAHEADQSASDPRRTHRASVEEEDDLENPSRMQRAYLPIIHWTVKHSALTLLFAFAVLIGTGMLTPFMKTNFLGESGQNTLSVTQTLPVGTSLDAQDTAAKEVEKTLRGIDGIDTVQLSIGSSGSSLRDAFSGGGAGAITYSITTDEDADQEALQKRVRSELDGINGAGDIEVAASSGFGGSSDIAVDITAARQSELNDAAAAVEQSLKDLDGIDQVTSNLSESRPYIAVKIDRDAAAAAGYSEVALGGMVSQLMQPTTAGTIVIDDTTLTIFIAAQNPPTTLEALAAATVPTMTGPVRLDQLATVSQVDGPSTITTVKGLRSATVSVTPASDNLSAASAEVQQALATVDLPAGATATLGGVSADQTTAFAQLGLALLAAILIVYIVMVATFRSLRQPLLLLISVPFAATGAIILQVITGVPLGVPSLIGVLMLIGIVVTNAIVLVDLVNQYRRRGMDVASAVAHGAARRLRPILMTALATIFALVPMALGITGHGGFISQPLAIVVIGGLVSSTFLTLIVLPSLYNLVEGHRERRDRRRAAKQLALAGADDVRDGAAEAEGADAEGADAEGADAAVADGAGRGGDESPAEAERVLVGAGLAGVAAVAGAAGAVGVGAGGDGAGGDGTGGDDTADGASSLGDGTAASVLTAASDALGSPDVLSSEATGATTSASTASAGQPLGQQFGEQEFTGWEFAGPEFASKEFAEKELDGKDLAGQELAGSADAAGHPGEPASAPGLPAAPSIPSGPGLAPGSGSPSASEPLSGELPPAPWQRSAPETGPESETPLAAGQAIHRAGEHHDGAHTATGAEQPRTEAIDFATATANAADQEPAAHGVHVSESSDAGSTDAAAQAHAAAQADESPWWERAPRWEPPVPPVARPAGSTPEAGASDPLADAGASADAQAGAGAGTAAGAGTEAGATAGAAAQTAFPAPAELSPPVEPLKWWDPEDLGESAAAVIVAEVSDVEISAAGDSSPETPAAGTSIADISAAGALAAGAQQGFAADAFAPAAPAAPAAPGADGEVATGHETAAIGDAAGSSASASAGQPSTAGDEASAAGEPRPAGEPPVASGSGQTADEPDDDPDAPRTRRVQWP